MEFATSEDSEGLLFNVSDSLNNDIGFQKSSQDIITNSFLNYLLILP